MRETTVLNDLKNGDIVAVFVESEFCGFPKGRYQGIIVDMKRFDKPVIVFTDILHAVECDVEGTTPYLEFEHWNKVWIELLHGSSYQ
ncbi:hypothetical protein [Listeria fleischmannii]|uniref:Uncharacterized protein n=1 Tax=Listeria fleischmannii FSL S10-1203 TaxID=1265822 RepID=W7DGX1_9LIST|nr:hypothetical protein [Listeria fleischmannii]EUJ48690.1 hypothetical protein MCOL2_17132 [Listeria fleischmannii FSL S10-1203]